MTTSSIKASVVITVFNKEERLVVRAINSALNQTLKPTEIIVVDDASTVGQYRELIAEIAATGTTPIHYIRLDTNSGPSVAANRGITAATGEYITFLDADDFWSPQKLEKQVAQIASSKYPERTVSSCRLIIMGEHTKRERVRPRTVFQCETTSIREYLFCHGGVLQTSTLVMRTALAKEIGFDNKLRSLTDIGFCLRLAAAGVEVDMLEEPLSYWWEDETTRRHSNNGRARERAFSVMKECYRDQMSECEWLGLIVRFTNTRPNSLQEVIARLSTGYRAWKFGAITTSEFLLRYLPRTAGLPSW